MNDSNIRMSNLLKKTQNRAVLNTVSSQTVALEIWFSIYFHTINDLDRQLVETAKSNRTFCFEDWVEVKAVKFPVTSVSIKGVRAYIEADIIKNDLPLLISHKQRKTAGMLLNFKSDSCQILGRYLQSQRTISGHHTLPLRKMLLRAEKSRKIILNCEVLEKCSELK